LRGYYVSTIGLNEEVIKKIAIA